MEKVDLWNLERTKILRTINRGEEIYENERRVSVHTYIVNDKDEILILKRSMNETHFQGWWSTVGGAVKSGENSLETAQIEIKEEIGIDVPLKNIELIHSYMRKSDFVDVYFIKQNVDLKNCLLDEEEVTEVKFASFSEIEKMIEEEKFIKQPYLNLIKEKIEKKHF